MVFIPKFVYFMQNVVFTIGVCLILGGFINAQNSMLTLPRDTLIVIAGLEEIIRRRYLTSQHQSLQFISDGYSGRFKKEYTSEYEFFGRFKFRQFIGT
jgi:hypothetical protein